MPGITERITIHANLNKSFTDGVPDLSFVIEYRANKAGLVLSASSVAEVANKDMEKYFATNLRDFCAVVLAALVRGNVEWRFKS